MSEHQCEICGDAFKRKVIGNGWCLACKREFKALFPPLSARERVNEVNRNNYRRNKGKINARRRANYKAKVLMEKAKAGAGEKMCLTDGE